MTTGERGEKDWIARAVVLKTFVGKLLKKSRGKDLFGKQNVTNATGKIPIMYFDLEGYSYGNQT